MAPRLTLRMTHEEAAAHLKAAEVAGQKRRRKAMLRARAAGSHTAEEWTALQAAFGGCVACHTPAAQCNPRRLTKDHILPISLGGSDSIGNIQPLCLQCNSRKGNRDWGDLRPSHWKRR